MTDAVLDAVSPQWRRLVESNAVFSGAVREFLAPDTDRVASVHHGLRAGGIERSTALQVFPYLSENERIQLFPDLVFLASSAHGSIGTVRGLILALPRSYVLSHIESEAEQYLQTGTCEEFRRFLELYLAFDPGLVSRLATRAAGEADSDIREAGEDFLSRIDSVH